VDIKAVRTFVAIAEVGQFQEVADKFGISQQAVSKRIMGLERNLGVSLLVRTSRGSRLSLDGQLFLPHAKKVLMALEDAEQAMRPGTRPLRVDVLNRRIAPAQAVHRFYHSRPDTVLDAVTLGEENAAQAAWAVLEGSLEASFRALPASQMPSGIRAERLLDAPLELLVGPAHPLAGKGEVQPTDLADHRLWIPGISPGTEWELFYQSLSQDFGMSIDSLGPNFGDEALMDALAESSSLATLVGTGDRYLWPENYGLRRVPLRGPTPVYPHMLLTRAGHQNPVLTELRDFLQASRPQVDDEVWVPGWVTY
jgi:DNA-binding transcriptional LysR family regulator